MTEPNRHAYASGRQDQYVVRLPDGMRDKIKAMAKANRRSMNAEIVFALDERMQAAAGEGFADTAPAASHQPRF